MEPPLTATQQRGHLCLQGHKNPYIVGMDKSNPLLTEVAVNEVLYTCMVSLAKDLKSLSCIALSMSTIL